MFQLCHQVYSKVSYLCPNLAPKESLRFKSCSKINSLMYLTNIVQPNIINFRLITGIKETGAVPSLKTLINGEFRVDLISNTLPVALNCAIGCDVFLWQQSGESEIYESELQEEGWNENARVPTLSLKAGEVIQLNRRNLSNSTTILVSQIELGGSVICVTNSTVINP